MNTIKYSVVRSTIASIKSINNSKNLNSFMIYRHTFSTQPDETKISNKKNEKKSDKKMKSEKSENEDLLTFFETAMKISEQQPPYTPEELAERNKLAKEYTIKCRRAENAMIKDLTTKIYLQQAALAALPEKFVKAARFIDETAPPKGRPFPYFETPPIKDFDFRKYIAKEADEDDTDGSQPK